jgi:hypothetical protein
MNFIPKILLLLRTTIWVFEALFEHKKQPLWMPDSEIQFASFLHYSMA